jgi:predicted AlkP superfamily phosphohydrolase/phosphomutase
VAVIGIDGMDAHLIERFGDSLPNIAALRKRAPQLKMRSVFPPDSPTAWASIYTGLNPAHHGVITFRDPFSNLKVGEHLSSDLSGRTFWDAAGVHGKKVCVLFPHLGYPVWQVNGVMVGRTTEVDIREYDLQTYPAELAREMDLDDLRPMSSFPLDLADLVEPTKDLIRREVRAGLELSQRKEWDLLFIYFSSLDNIQHLFWMYYDDLYGNAGEKLKGVIPDFYQFYDREVIGPIVSSLSEDVNILVISDHGHGLRPRKVVNVNEILREKEFLTSKVSDSGISRYSAWNGMRKLAAKTINEHRVVGKMAATVLKHFPNSVRLYTNTVPVDYDTSKAFVSDPSGGLKAYSYGGIRIVPENLNGMGYEEARDQLIDLVLGISSPAEDLPIAECACRREELYSGGHIEKYPDILFKLRDDWGVGWDIGSEVYTQNITHKLHSGNHRQETAVLLTRLVGDRRIDRSEVSLIDLSPTILDLLEVDHPARFDGRSILQPRGDRA